MCYMKRLHLEQFTQNAEHSNGCVQITSALQSDLAIKKVAGEGGVLFYALVLTECKGRGKTPLDLRC
jgi:hypothetical protein